uniref:Uncharacterized protein n=1 Tax=Anguilla anguilla TaxID=7936 RepID=A0A0E9V2D3_ANGAN
MIKDHKVHPCTKDNGFHSKAPGCPAIQPPTTALCVMSLAIRSCLSANNLHCLDAVTHRPRVKMVNHLWHVP